MPCRGPHWGRGWRIPAVQDSHGGGWQHKWRRPRHRDHQTRQNRPVRPDPAGWHQSHDQPSWTGISSDLYMQKKNVCFYPWWGFLKIGISMNTCREKLWIIQSALNSAMWPSYLPEDWRVCWSQGWWRVCPPSSASCSWWSGSMFHSMAVVGGGRATLSSTGSISQRACWTPAGPASPTPTLTHTNTQVSLTYSVVQLSLYTPVYLYFPLPLPYLYPNYPYHPLYSWYF